MENTKWVIDPAHSALQFTVKHLMISTLRGTFTEIEGTVEAGEHFENAKFSFSAKVSSINTNDEKRDTHLKSADFFDAEKFPKLSFSSTSFTKKGDDIFELIGNLTIKGITKPVTLTAIYGGIAIDPWANTKAGFEIKGAIDRKEYGLTWNVAIEAGGTMVSEEVAIIADIQLLKK